jgi:saccharopine dehydrogenase-like NADP-dependent oxidoreductase
MGFKVLIIGLGAQGRVLSYLFDKTDDVEEVRIASRRYEVVKQYSRKLEKAVAYKVYADNIDQIKQAGKGVDLIVNAVIPKYNLYIMRAALDINANYIDMAFGPPYENIDYELRMDSDFRVKGLSAITSSGLTPGTTNILAALAADELESVHSIKIGDAEVVECDVPFSSWSPETFIADCLEEDTFVFDNGELKRVPPFSGREIIKLPRIGPQPMYFHAHEEQVTLARFIGKGVRYVEFKIGGPALDFLAELYRVGLLSKNEVNLKGQKIRPIDLYLALAPKPPTPEELRSMISEGIMKSAQEVAYIIVEGEKQGIKHRYTYYVYSPDIHELMEKVPPANYSSYLVSTGCYILSLMQCRGEIEPLGVVVPERLTRKVRLEYLMANTHLDPIVEIELRVDTTFY